MVSFAYKLIYQDISLVLVLFNVPTVPPYSQQLSLGDVLFPLRDGYIPVAVCGFEKGFRGADMHC